MCVGGGGGEGGGRGRGKLPMVRGQDTPGYLVPGDKLPGFGVGLGQDKLLHRLKLDTDEERNHLVELSHNKCIRQ